MATIQINVSDEISPMLLRMLEHNKAYMRHVTKSLGYMFQKETKAGVSSGSPGGETFPERLPYKLRKAVGKAGFGWYGKMVRAIGYAYNANSGTVDIGWTSSTAAMYGRIQEFGVTKDVTPNMRKHWAAAGYPLSPFTQELEVPARPVFDPMAAKLEPEIPSYVEKKLESYMTENVEYGKKNRRTYKVYK